MKLPGSTVLLDGSMGEELGRRGVRLSDAIWSAAALLEAPDAVRGVHVDYILAGADIITTNTYGLVRRNFAEAGLQHRLTELNKLACALAREALDAAARPVLVAGSLPPQFGTYQPDKVRPFEELEPLYREQAEALADGVDLFLCETMSSAAEAYAAARAACATGKPVWVSWTLRDDGSGRLRSGETISEAAAVLADLPVSALLVNCSAPESVSAVMPSLVATGVDRVGGYANTYQSIPEDFGNNGDDLEFRTDLNPDQYAAHASDWLRAGATVVGGCCGTQPAHIAKLRAMLGGV